MSGALGYDGRTLRYVICKLEYVRGTFEYVGTLGYVMGTLGYVGGEAARLCDTLAGLKS